VVVLTVPAFGSRTVTPTVAVLRGERWGGNDRPRGECGGGWEEAASVHGTLQGCPSYRNGLAKDAHPDFEEFLMTGAQVGPSLSPAWDSGLPELHPKEDGQRAVAQRVGVGEGRRGNIGQPGREAPFDQIVLEFDTAAEGQSEVE